MADEEGAPGAVIYGDNLNKHDTAYLTVRAPLVMSSCFCPMNSKLLNNTRILENTGSILSSDLQASDRTEILRFYERPMSLKPI